MPQFCLLYETYNKNLLYISIYNSHTYMNERGLGIGGW